MHMIMAIAALACFSMALLPAQAQTSRAEQEISWLNSRVNDLNWDLQQKQQELQRKQWELQQKQEELQRKQWECQQQSQTSLVGHEVLLLQSEIGSLMGHEVPSLQSETSSLQNQIDNLNMELQQKQAEARHRQSVREMSQIPMPPNCSHMEISPKGRVKFVYDNGKVQTCKFRKVSSTRSAVPLGIVAGSGGEMNTVSESENYQSGIRRERAEFALPDWKPYDTWADRVGKDGKPIPFTRNDFRRHSDRLRSGRFQGGFLAPDFRERFIVAMMGEVGGGDPDYQGRFASANAAYRRAMTEYSNQFEKWGRQKLAAQNRAWAAAHPEEARKRRAAAEERKYQEQVDSAIREAMINSLRRIR